MTLTHLVPTTRLAQPSLSLPTPANGVQPEAFQTQLIQGMTQALLRTPSPPCLLRAPTGSGKTFVISQVLARVSSQREVVWFWFVPFVTLVAQTLDALLSNAPGLSPTLFSAGRNQDVQGGAVLISTAQGVARAQWRTKGYDADGDDDVRTLAALVARARAKSLQVGLVVDEAHIGLDKSTEFGKFAHWLKADYLLMATATPKDERLNEFLVHAGYDAQESFAVSRDAVVNARLNKKYIEAVVYSLGETMQHVTDLRRTVLQQAWLRNVRIGKALAAAGVQLTPLLLVQVANGDKTVEEAANDLMRLCRVPPEAIGKHSSDAPDPVLMAAIANDTTKRVLIFKQSAGTGFDAPRAFVLASTKPVNDADFAMQFIGRVMRVARPVRDVFAKPQDIPAALNTAYVYLGHAQAQAGFEAAVQATAEVKNQLEGQTERLLARQTMSGAVVYTNRPTDEAPMAYDWGRLPDADVPVSNPAVIEFGLAPAQLPQPVPSTRHDDLWGGDMWGDAAKDAMPELDVMKPGADAGKAASRTKSSPPKNRAAVLQALAAHRLRVFPLKSPLPQLARSLKTEEKPELNDLSEISRAVASRLVISPLLQATAVKAALNRIKQKERHTELTTGAEHVDEIQVVTDRAALAREAMAALRELPQAEEEDYKIIVQVISSNLRRAVDDEIDNLPEDLQATEPERVRLARDAAHWVIRSAAQDLREDMFSEIAKQARSVDAKPLPDVMVFPQDMALESSSKNIYGVLPPASEDAQRVEQVLFMDDRHWWADRTFVFDDGSEFTVGRFDGAVKLNNLERSFARALDDADFVLWWHRNPDKKAYAVRVVRGEHEHYFYPDFVVCLKHNPADAPMQRLLETKENTKDAARKARHTPSSYGKVLFLTPDGTRLRWVNDDGSLGERVNLADMGGVLARFAATRPVMTELVL